MGQKKAKGRRVPFQNGWDELKAFLEEGILRKRHPKTVVIDTVSNLYEMAFMFYCEQQGIEHPADQTHGKGWAGVKREFMRGVGVLLEQCELMGTTVVMIAHSKNEEFDAGSRKYTRIRVDLPGQARSVVVPVPDHIWYLGIHTDSGEDSLTHFHGNRALWMQPTAIVEAGGQDKTIDTVTMISPLNKSGQYQQILDYIAEARRKNDDG
jgi:hypothetical protein